MEDRRKFRRLNVIVEGVYNRKTISEQEKYFKAKNISTGGLCIYTDENFNQDEALSLRIFLPGGGSPINSEGRVAWVRQAAGEKLQGLKFEVGIQLIGPSEEDKIRIANFIDFFYKKKA